MIPIIKGKTQKPRLCCIYGVPGIGKTTWAADAPNPLFIMCEDGAGDIGPDRTPVIEDHAIFLDVLRDVYTENHDYQTLVVDTIDLLEQLIFAKVAKEGKKENVADIPYGAGYVAAANFFSEIIRALVAIRDHRQMHIILIAHSEIKRFDAPGSEGYDRYTPTLHKRTWPVVANAMDEVLFANYLIYTTSEEKGFNQKRTIAKGGTERVLYTTDKPAHTAKNRLGMPDDIPLKWAEYARYFNPQQTEKEQTNG